jgi:hypothetical protein
VEATDGDRLVTGAGGGREAARRMARAGLLAPRRVGAGLRRLPDFVIVGAQKAGTSSLYARLAAHPGVRPALRKEVHYFDRWPQPSLDWYRAHFPLDARHRAAWITGEASPSYLVHPAVPERMRGVLPDVRLVAILRDPAARAVSGYHHAVRFGFESRPIDVALDPRHADTVPVGEVACYDDPGSPVRRRGYLERGRYAEQLERWFRVFARDRVLVVESSELRDAAGVSRVHEFLGLADLSVAAPRDRNVGTYGPAPPSVLEELARYFAPYNEALFDLLGQRFGSWH